MDPVSRTPADARELIAAISVLTAALATAEHPTVLGVTGALNEARLVVIQNREPFDVALRGTVRDTARARRTRTHFDPPPNPLYIEPKDLPNA